CRVLLCSRGGADLEAACAQANGVAVAADLTTQEGVAAAVAAGPVDILVNNLGGSGARRFQDSDDDDLGTILDKNLWPAFRLSRALVPGMRARGGGCIVMIGWIWGREGGGVPADNLGKAG